MRIANERSDALEIICRLHREIKDIMNTLSELEYLIYETDERCKIEYFKKENNEALRRHNEDQGK